MSVLSIEYRLAHRSRHKYRADFSVPNNGYILTTFNNVGPFISIQF
jgi:hypothetical protein